jgi:hypothetical protein
MAKLFHVLSNMNNTTVFASANDVKALVPIVMDTSRDMPTRVQALLALIRNGTLDDKSAFDMTATLLRAGLLRSEVPAGHRWNGDHPLVDVLVARMPSALEPLLNRYISDSTPDDQIDKHTRHDIAEFWRVVFVRTLTEKSDEQLALLNSDEFLVRCLTVMNEMLDRPMDAEKEKAWFARAPKGLQILAALRSVGEVGMGQHALGRKYLLAVVSTPRTDASSLQLAGTIIRLQEERQWVSRALATLCLEIVLREDEDMRTMPHYYNRSLAAESYVEWYAKAKRDEVKTPFAAGDGGDGWDEIQPALTTGLENYLARVANEEIRASDFGPTIRRNSIALPLARILLDGISRGEKPSKATRQLLSKMTSYSDERLGALLLDRIEFRGRVAKALAQ